VTTIFDQSLVGYRFIDTQYGDTLQRIAYRELGDATQWPLLIAYNKLLYPFITDDPTLSGPGVILTGQQIIVPAPTPVVEATPDPTQVFEIDVALDANGDLQSDASGDFATVSGNANLVQALNGRVVTDVGELLFHNTYGNLVRQLLGALNGPNAGLLASEYLAGAVLADPRVLDVQSSNVTIVGDEIQVVMAVNPVVGQAIAFKFSL
jgi:hypothetical protein